MTDDVKAKMSESAGLRWLDPIEHEKASVAAKERMTDEVRLKISTSKMVAKVHHILKSSKMHLLKEIVQTPTGASFLTNFVELGRSALCT